MDTNKRGDLVRTFFCFGMTVYLVSFFAMVHFYRVSKEVFREGFGSNFIWPISGIDFNCLYMISFKIRNGELALGDYPPLTGIAFIPFTYLSQHLAYVVFTYILVVLLFLTVFLCLRENKTFETKEMGLFIALLCTGLFYHTYPVLFALERGQTEILFGFFMIAGLFAISRNFRKTAVVALTLATQYKVYPVILGSILFIRYRWKILAAFIGLNVLMLFIRGRDVGVGYIEMLRNKIHEPAPWPGNHCLQSFVCELIRFKKISPDLEVPVTVALTCVVILIFMLTFLWVVFKRKPPVPSTLSVVEAGLIGMAFQLMSFLPSTGHDYKLPIHIIPFLLMISRNKADFTIPKEIVYVLMAALAASMAFMFVPFFLIKTFGVMASFIIYAIFAFSPADPWKKGEYEYK